MATWPKKPSLADWWLLALLALGLSLWLLDQARQPTRPAAADWPLPRNSSTSP